MYTDNDIKMIYDRNIDMLYRIAYTYFKGDKAKIEDAIQDLFLKVIDKNIKFESIEHEKKWFIVAFRNVCKNMLKRKWNEETTIDFDIKDKNKDDGKINLLFNLMDTYLMIDTYNMENNEVDRIIYEYTIKDFYNTLLINEVLSVNPELRYFTIRGNDDYNFVNIATINKKGTS